MTKVAQPKDLTMYIVQLLTVRYPHLRIVGCSSRQALFEILIAPANGETYTDDAKALQDAGDVGATCHTALTALDIPHDKRRVSVRIVARIVTA